MPTVKLIHPKYGVHKQHIGEYKNCCVAVERWKQLYGQKMKECTVKWEYEVVPNTKNRRIIHIPTGNIYDTLRQAARGTGVDDTTVYNHCHRNLKSYVEYKFKFE